MSTYFYINSHTIHLLFSTDFFYIICFYTIFIKKINQSIINNGSEKILSIKKKEKKKWYKEVYKNIKTKVQTSEAKDKFSDFLELPTEVVNSSTKVTSIENKDILIEGYKQIMDYYDDYIKIKAHNMELVIDGKNLDIKEITDYELVIQGEIYSLNYKK